jgi:hypothetical protein
MCAPWTSCATRSHIPIRADCSAVRVRIYLHRLIVTTCETGLDAELGTRLWTSRHGPAPQTEPYSAAHDARINKQFTSGGLAFGDGSIGARDIISPLPRATDRSYTCIRFRRDCGADSWVPFATSSLNSPYDPSLISQPLWFASSTSYTRYSMADSTA